MAKHQLNVGQKESLKRHVRKIVGCPDIKPRLDKLYEKSKVIVQKLVDAKCPPADIEVLRKYGCTSCEQSIKLRLADGQVIAFEVRHEDASRFRVPDKYEYRHGIYLLDKKSDSDTLQEYLDAKTTYDAALKAKHADYDALINSTKYAEDLVAIWPEAKALTDQWTQGKALVCISPETVARIQADVKQRARAAKKQEAAKAA